MFGCVCMYVCMYVDTYVLTCVCMNVPHVRAWTVGRIYSYSVFNSLAFIGQWPANLNILCRIWGLHSGGFGEYYHLGYNSVQSACLPPACHLLSLLHLARFVLRSWRWMCRVLQKRRLICSGLHGVMSQKISTIDNHRCENLRSYIIHFCYFYRCVSKLAKKSLSPIAAPWPSILNLNEDIQIHARYVPYRTLSILSLFVYPCHKEGWTRSCPHFFCINNIYISPHNSVLHTSIESVHMNGHFTMFPVSIFYDILVWKQ
jgi:hypothetical protein